ncbi:polysaccharide pyruvyl transferase family protein [Agrococcus jejuensis]|uniref:Polysaccharide pyruvyl transferase family protein WcaK n=1 Tax=Agrococcus jejuensis TaxID=399736 RepID=A0A1G8FGY6_9MICO|nr:polysaccharide pyruvyl transferase family protein [Agrococcus jejuensis]SDH81332.1 Polysaccharide pyruvyl transferase family protein WcaK [Agrococcus jejuensis]
MRVLIIGDVGVQDGALHAGDEAMLAEAVRQLRARGATEVLAVSSTPDDTAARYGVVALPRLGFSLARQADETQLEARLDALTRAGEGERGALQRDDPAHAVLDAVATCDLVVVAGAGNLSSLWPHHVYERAAIVRIATALSRPVVVSGQTVGPTLSERHGALVREMLRAARLVGVREAASAALLARLDDALAPAATYDDALAIAGEAPAGLPERFCAATVPPSTGLWPRDRVVEAMAALLDHVVERHDLDVVLVPHVAPLDGSLDADAATHADVVGAMRHAQRVTSLGPVEPAQTAAVVAASSLVVSARYHPVVFGLASGIPSVGVTVDEYTETKIAGALEAHGLGDLTVPVIAAATGDAAAIVDAAMAIDRAELVARGEHARAEMERWWDAVAATATEDVPAPSIAYAEHLPVVDEALRAEVDRLAAWQRHQSQALVGSLLIADDLERVLARHTERVRVLENALGEAEAARVEAVLRAQEHEQALTAAHERLGDVAEPVIERMWAQTRSRRHLPGEELAYAIAQRDEAFVQRNLMEAELAAVLSTRMMRWTSGARRAYRAMRGR